MELLEKNKKNPEDNVKENIGGKIARKYLEIEELLTQDWKFRFNVIKGSIEFASTEDSEFVDLDDYSLNSIVREIRSCNVAVSGSTIDEVLRSNFITQVNPIQEYLKALKYRKKDYIKVLADTIECENDNWYEYLKKWLVGSVANVMVADGCQNHTCLVLTGDQGKFKTTWLDYLIPKKLNDYLYTGKIDPHNKDVMTYISEYFLINIDDQLRNLNKIDENALKTLITLPSIKYRKPYGRYVTKHNRIASFMGSVNGKDFLTDPSGSRRFLPFEVKDIYIDKVKEIDIDDVWSHAYSLFQEGFRYWFNDEEIETLYQHNTSFQVHTIEHELVMEYFEPASRDKATHFYTSTRIKTYIENLTNQKLRSKPLGEALNKLGYEKWQKSIDSQIKWVWSVNKLDTQLIESRNENNQDDEKEAF